MKHFGMTVVAAGLALTSAYFFGAQSVGWAEAGSDTCRYSLESVASTMTMHARLNVTLDAATPSGESTPDLHSALRLNISALDEGCDDVTIERMVFDLTATDAAASGWVRRAARSGITIEDVETGEVLAQGVASRIIGQGVRFNSGSFLVSSGTTRTVDVYVDADGASADLDDALRLDLSQNGLTWSDESRTIREMNAVITGGTIFF